MKKKPKVLKYKHYCDNWDGMLINELMIEFECCLCYTEEEIKKDKELKKLLNR